MTLKFPDAEETIRCPYHGKDAAFCTDKAPSKTETIIRRDGATQGDKIVVDQIKARFCRTCGRPVIQYLHALRPISGGFWSDTETMLYPVSPRRDLSGQALPTASEGVANDYDEAVNCESHSLQAAAFLLGRCVERMLVDKCKDVVKPGQTLGVMIRNSVDVLEVTPALKTVLQNGFLTARNQAGHVWTSASGAELTVDEDSVENCFKIVQELHFELYERPKRHKDFEVKMQGVHAKKKKGEEKDA